MIIRRFMAVEESLKANYHISLATGRAQPIE